jgi:hypothetical protein
MRETISKEYILEWYGEPCEFYDAGANDGQCPTCQAWDVWSHVSGEKIRYRGIEVWGDS